MRSWNTRTLIQSLPVEAGRPVVLRVFARSVPSMTGKELKRILEKDTLAHQAAAYYQRGVNAGNFLEVPPNQTWSVAHTEDDFKQMKAEGRLKQSGCTVNFDNQLVGPLDGNDWSVFASIPEGDFDMSGTFFGNPATSFEGSFNRIGEISGRTGRCPAGE